MKTNILRALVYAMAIIQIGCGSGSSPESTTQDKESNQCPQGIYLSKDSFNEITIGGNRDLILNMNRCYSGGYVTDCNSTGLTMVIESNDPQLGNPQQCQGVGTFLCTFSSIGGGNYTLKCADSGTVTNRFKTGMVFETNNGI